MPATPCHSLGCICFYCNYAFNLKLNLSFSPSPTYVFLELTLSNSGTVPSCPQKIILKCDFLWLHGIGPVSILWYFGSFCSSDPQPGPLGSPHLWAWTWTGLLWPPSPQQMGWVRGSGFPPHGWLGWRWWGHNSGEGEGLCNSLGSAPGLSGTRSLLWLPKCDLVYKILHFANPSFALEFSWAMN